MVRKLSVLCLHGYSMTGAVFEQSMRRVSERLGSVARFSFLDGPHVVPPNPNLPMPLPDGVAPLGWWKPERLADGNWHFHGIEDSIAYLADAQAAEVRAHGHGFDAVLGFSQGAAFAHLVCALEEHRPGMRILPNLGGAVFVGGFPFAPAQPRFEESSVPITLPTLHVVGARDKIVKPTTSARLLELCAEDARTYHGHQGGHVVHSGTESLALYESWFSARHVERGVRCERTEGS